MKSKTLCTALNLMVSGLLGNAIGCTQGPRQPAISDHWKISETISRGKSDAASEVLSVDCGNGLHVAVIRNAGVTTDVSVAVGIWPVYSYQSKGPLGTPQSTYYGNTNDPTGKIGMASVDYNNDGIFDLKVSANERGGQIWYEGSWVKARTTSVEKPDDAISDDGRHFKFNMQTGKWEVQARSGSPK